MNNDQISEKVDELADHENSSNPHSHNSSRGPSPNHSNSELEDEESLESIETPRHDSETATQQNLKLPKNAQNHKKSDSQNNQTSQDFAHKTQFSESDKNKIMRRREIAERLMQQNSGVNKIQKPKTNSSIKHSESVMDSRTQREVVYHQRSKSKMAADTARDTHYFDKQKMTHQSAERNQKGENRHGFENSQNDQTNLNNSRVHYDSPMDHKNYEDSYLNRSVNHYQNQLPNLMSTQYQSTTQGKIGPRKWKRGLSEKLQSKSKYASNPAKKIEKIKRSLEKQRIKSRIGMRIKYMNDQLIKNQNQQIGHRSTNPHSFSETAPSYKWASVQYSNTGGRGSETSNRSLHKSAMQESFTPKYVFTIIV